MFRMNCDYGGNCHPAAAAAAAAGEYKKGKTVEKAPADDTLIIS